MKWEVDTTSCWPRCETGASVLLFDPAARRMRMIPVTRDRLKDCDECRGRVWQARQGRWLRHLWIEDDAMWVARGRTVTGRPAELWTGRVDPTLDRRMREARNWRERAAGVAIDYFRVTFDDGTVFVVAAEDLSPRDQALSPVAPADAWERLGGAYTGEGVRRHKGRTMSAAWDVPSWFVGGGPVARSARLRAAVRSAGFDDWTVPEDVSWERAAAAIEAEVRSQGTPHIATGPDSTPCL